MCKLSSLNIREKLSSPVKVGEPKASHSINASPNENITGISVNIAKPMKFGSINVHAINVFLVVIDFIMAPFEIYKDLGED